MFAHDFRVDVKIMAKSASPEQAEAAIAPLAREIEARLDGNVFGTGDETPASAALAALRARGELLAVAESCTGGRIAAALTRVAGASQSFAGGVVAYANEVKISQLGVEPASIERFGAVSEEVAGEMAAGARDRFGAGVALATTGIAGPGGGTAQKPVGSVWIALAGDGCIKSRRFQLDGDRETVTSRATTIALSILWRYAAGYAP